MAIRKKVYHCSKCGKNTMHRLVEHVSDCEGLGPFRLLFAVCSLGATETVHADWFYQCSQCGEITERSELSI